MLPVFLRRMAKGDKSAAFMFNHHVEWEHVYA